MLVKDISRDVFLIIASYLDPASYKNMRLVAKHFKQLLDNECFAAKLLLNNMKMVEIKQLNEIVQNRHAFKTISNPSERIKLAAVRNYGLDLEYISNPSEQVQIAAVEQNAFAIGYINHPSKTVRLVAAKSAGLCVQSESLLSIVEYLSEPVKALKKRRVKE
jgi:protein tyrosine phosphatase (PTP) superfamily phosphohydrolase (DUF442 family)